MNLIEGKRYLVKCYPFSTFEEAKLGIRNGKRTFFFDDDTFIGVDKPLEIKHLYD